MKKTLGLDIGTNSVGWAWVDETTETIYLGSHIFQEGKDRDKSYQEQSRNEVRQQKRTMRRGYFRYKLRRARLRYVLNQHGMLPPGEWAATLSARDIYLLRKRALSEALTQHELGQVLLHLNQYRGYNATRAELADAGEQTEDKTKKKLSEYKQLLESFEKNFQASGMPTVGAYFFSLFEKQEGLGHNGEPIDQPITRIRNWNGGSNIVLRQRYVEEYDAIIKCQSTFHPVLNEKVQSLSRYKQEKGIMPTLGVQIRDEIIYYQRRLKSARHMVLPCSYEFELYKYKITSDNANVVKVRYEHRQRGLPCAPVSHPYYQEFRIWKQLHNLRIKEAEGAGTKKYMVPDDDTGRLNVTALKKLASVLMEKEELTNKEINQLLELKRGKLDQHTQDGEESGRTIKGNKTHVRLRNALTPAMYDSLTGDQQMKLWEWANTATSPDYLKKIAEKAAQKWQMPALLSRVNQYAGVVLEDDYGRLSAKACRKLLPYMKGEGEDATLPIPADKEAEFANALAQISKGVMQKIELEPGEIRSWKGLFLPEDSAIRLLYGHHSDSRTHTDPNRKLDDFLEPINAKDLRNPVVTRSLAQAIRVVNAILKDPRMGKPDVVRVEMARELSKPKKQRDDIYKQNLDNYRQRAEDIKELEKLGRAEPTHRDISIYRAAKEAMGESGGKAEFDLNELETGAPGISGWAKGKSKLLRYRLWKENDQKCIYSGQTISFSDLFTGVVDLDHIVPRSLGGSNAKSNLAICFSAQNQLKGNRIPYQVWGSNAEYWRAFKSRIMNSRLPKAKKELLLMEELPRGFALGQLSDTAWVARELTWRLRRVVAKVAVSKGAITSELRGAWMKGPGGLRLPAQPSKQPSPLKDRTNHLHHAMDAAVIAAVPYELEQQLIQKAKEGALTNWRKSEFETEVNKAKHLPWPSFKEDVNRALAEALVSHQKQSRLLAKKRNSYKYWRTHERNHAPTDQAPQKPLQRGYSVRGALHAETYYGIREDAEKKTFYTTRKPLNTDFTAGQLAAIVDKQVRAAVEQHINTHGGTDADIAKRIKTALHPDVLKEHPIYMPNHNARLRLEKQGLPPEKAPRPQIKAVRIREESTSMLKLHPSREASPYVEPANNYLFALYRGKAIVRKGKAEKEETLSKGDMLTYLEAVQRKLAGEALLAQQMEGLPLLLTLQQGDLVIPYAPDEDPRMVMELPQGELAKRLYRVRSMSITPNLYIIFEHHTVANGSELTRSKGDEHIASRFDNSKTRNLLRIVSFQNLSIVPVRLNVLGQIIFHRLPPP